MWSPPSVGLPTDSSSQWACSLEDCKSMTTWSSRKYATLPSIRPGSAPSPGGRSVSPRAVRTSRSGSGTTDSNETSSNRTSATNRKSAAWNGPSMRKPLPAEGTTTNSSFGKTGINKKCTNLTSIPLPSRHSLGLLINSASLFPAEALRTAPFGFGTQTKENVLTL